MVRYLCRVSREDLKNNNFSILTQVCVNDDVFYLVSDFFPHVSDIVEFIGCGSDELVSVCYTDFEEIYTNPNFCLSELF